MNFFNKIYCRTFQTVFKLAIPILPYKKAKLLSSDTEIADILEEKNIFSVLLVTDSGVRSLGLTKRLENALEKKGIKTAVYGETAANPTTEDVKKAKRIYLENKCEAVIAFGGGSSIDCAKITGAAVMRPKRTVGSMKGILKVYWKTPPLFAVPTTAGTGSEATLAAVIVDAETRHKYAVNSFPLMADYAVLDPKVTVSLPKELTAGTGMDALTHAVEAYIGRSVTGETERDALEAVRLIYENILTAYNEPDNLNARKNMLTASYLAGKAFTKSYVGYVHSVAHSLGGEYNVPHGLANAVLLPYVLESYGDCIYKKLKKMGVYAGICSEKDSVEKAAEKFICTVKELEREMNIPKKLGCIKEKDIPRLAKYAAKEANPLYPVPKLMTAKELEKFYYMIKE